MSTPSPLLLPDTRTLVKEAANALLQEGVRPTVANVRARIGRGSAGTINEALKDWWVALGERLQNPEREHLPDAVLSAAEMLWRAALEQADTLLQTYKNEAAAQVKAADAGCDAALLAQREAEKRVLSAESRIAQLEEIRLDLERALADERGRREVIEQQRQHSQRQLEEAQFERRRERDEANRRLALEIERAETAEQRLMIQLDEHKVALKGLEKDVAEERQLWRQSERQLQDQLRETFEKASEQKARADALDDRLSGALSEVQTLRAQVNALLAGQEASKRTATLLERERDQYREAVGISEKAIGELRAQLQSTQAGLHRYEATCDALREENSALRKLLAREKVHNQE